METLNTAVIIPTFDNGSEYALNMRNVPKVPIAAETKIQNPLILTHSIISLTPLYIRKVILKKIIVVKK